MAFLCPVRIPTKKKKKVLSPILPQDDIKNDKESPSGSMETLVKGNSHEKHLVLHDFTPCVDDELEVKRGDVVSLLYREHDWAYVLFRKKEGFIPFSYLVVDERNGGGVPGGSGEDVVRESKKEGEEMVDVMGTVTEFSKNEEQKYITLYTFHAQNENDITIHRGEILTILNKDDADWFWVRKDANNSEDEEEQEEGFVPSAFIFPLNYFKEAVVAKENTNNAVMEIKSHGMEKGKKKTTELVLLYDYKGQFDELSSKRGDWVYADLECQTVEGWLWVWSEKQGRYGFLPRAWCRVPAMTSL